MKHILFIGGMATGKTTTVEAMADVAPDIHCMYLSAPCVRIPMHLERTCYPDLMRKTREAYIERVVANREIDWKSLPSYPRDDMDAFGQRILDRYGETIHVEVASACMKPNVRNLFDNVARVSAVAWLKEQQFYVVGFTCPLEERVRRRLQEPRDIDPQDSDELKGQMLRTERFFEVQNSLPLADIVYNTGEITGPDWREGYRDIAREIDRATR